MKGLSVLLTIVLLFLAAWLPGRLKEAGTLPAGQTEGSSPALNVAKIAPAPKSVRF